LGREGFGDSFFFIIQNSHHLGGIKNCIGGGFWKVLEGSHEFFKINLSCYNIVKIKYILIISINLSFFLKTLSIFLENFSIFP